MSARIVLYSGKGGVGKTSLSAATAIRAAKLGRRTLVVSTDSAHSLADALDRKVGADPTPVLPGLDAVEIDVNQELASHWGTIHEYLTRFMTFRGIDETVAEEIAILPGMEELFSLVRVKAWAECGRWDFIVIDCAPTGDTVRMLAVPEVLSFYFSRILPLQRTVVRTVRPVAQRMTDMPIPSDDVFGAVKRVYDEMEGVGPLLQDPKRSSIRIVLNPERMVINESQRLYTYLSLFGFSVDAVIANRVLPEEARSRYFDRWFDIQAGHLASARADFDPLPFFEAPLFDREMVGTEMLDEFGRRVFGRTDPSAVLHREKPLEVKKEGGAYALYLRLPFAEKDRIQVFARGDELVVQVDNQRRTIVLPRTLAGRAVAGAGFADQRLRVAFGRTEGPGAGRSQRRGDRGSPAAWCRSSSRRSGSTVSGCSRSTGRCSRASSWRASGSSSAWSGTGRPHPPTGVAARSKSTDPATMRAWR
jgi:arsenite-transporting ATPase